MPTPVGHAIAGLAIGWLSKATTKTRHLIAACVVAAVIPDGDILLDTHRTYSHSIGAACLIGVIAWLIARRRHPRAFSIGITVAIAYGTHVLLDWLAKDTAPPIGLMALWPFSSRFYLSGANLFLEVSRRYWKPDEFIVGNLRAVRWELVVLGPIAACAWWLRKRRGRVGMSSLAEDRESGDLFVP